MVRYGNQPTGRVLSAPRDPDDKSQDLHRSAPVLIQYFTNNGGSSSAACCHLTKLIVVASELLDAAAERGQRQAVAFLRHRRGVMRRSNILFYGTAFYK